MVKTVRKCLISVAFILALCVSLSGCKQSIAGEDDMEIESNGTLVRVEYAYRGGTVYGEDFDIDLSRDKINVSSFFPEGTREMTTVNNVPISAEQWEQIESAVTAITLVIEKSEAEDEGFLSALMEKIRELFHAHTVLDGGDESSFYLTWEQGGEEFRIEYDIPADRRFMTLIDILKETADPIGREITYYDAPVLNGIFFFMDASRPSEKFSYQCTVIDEAEGTWRFIAYFYEDGKTASYQTTVYSNTWERIAAQCNELSLESLEEGSRKAMSGTTLYFDDGRQQTKNPGKETRAVLENFFKELVKELRAVG